MVVCYVLHERLWWCKTNANALGFERISLKPDRHCTEITDEVYAVWGRCLWKNILYETAYVINKLVLYCSCTASEQELLAKFGVRRALWTLFLLFIYFLLSCSFKWNKPNKEKETNEEKRKWEKKTDPPKKREEIQSKREREMIMSEKSSRWVRHR